MITPQRAQLRWRVLIVDDELAQPETAGGRAVRGLAEELSTRGIDVVEALSLEDGSATAGSDAGLHCILINSTPGKNDARSHTKATELLRLIRASNAKIPIFLLADRRGIAGSLTPEVATLSDEVVWVLEDTACCHQ